MPYESIRKSLHNRLGIDDEPKKTSTHKNDALIMKDSLYSVVDMARPRLIMGAIRYDSNWKHTPLMNYMQKKFDIYKETGNFEMLVDLFNFIAIEHQLKTHPMFHFDAKDDH